MQERYRQTSAADEVLPALKLKADLFARWGYDERKKAYEQVVADLVDRHAIVPEDRRQLLERWLQDAISTYFYMLSLSDRQLTDKQALTIRTNIAKLGSELSDKLASLYGFEPSDVYRPSFSDTETRVITTGGNTTLSESQERCDAVVVSGVLVSNAVIILSDRVATWAIRNQTSGSFSVICKVSGQSGVEIERGAERRIYCDGTKINLGDPPTAQPDWASSVRRIKHDMERYRSLFLYYHPMGGQERGRQDVIEVMEIVLRAYLIPQGRRSTKEENASKIALDRLGDKINEFWITQGLPSSPKNRKRSAYFKFAKYIYAFVGEQRCTDPAIIKRLQRTPKSVQTGHEPTA